MSHFHRRKFLQSGVVALANFVLGEPLPTEAQVETKNAFLTAEDREKILFRNVERLLTKAQRPNNQRS